MDDLDGRFLALIDDLTEMHPTGRRRPLKAAWVLSVDMQGRPILAPAWWANGRARELDRRGSPLNAGLLERPGLAGRPPLPIRILGRLLDKTYDLILGGATAIRHPIRWLDSFG